MLKIKKTEPNTYKTVKYKDLKIGDVFEPTTNIIFEIKCVYIKTEYGRFKITDFLHISSDKKDTKEMNELVYLLDAELNVKRILE